LKVLILGYSNLVKKRVIKTFLKKKINFSVASKSETKKISGANKQFNSYSEGLKFSNSDIVYISLPNSMHYYWAKKALSMGYHVVVDKPICEKMNEVKNLIQLSKKKKKLLAEATFFNYHQQFSKAIDLIGDTHNVNYIHANFTIPSPEKKNFRSSIKTGGGVLMDMGPYISSIARIFFKSKITSKCIKLIRNKSKLITSINFIFNYSTKIYTGTFKFGGNYKNELLLFTDKKSIKISRVFSPPDNENLFLQANENYNKKYYKIKRDNCFENFFIELEKNLLNKKFNYYMNRIIFDANFRKLLK